MKVAFTLDSLADLKDISRWIARDDPDRARAFVQRLYETALSLGRQPERYPVARRIGGEPVRKRRHRDYLIFYRVAAKEVQILRIVHGARDWAALLDGLD